MTCDQSTARRLLALWAKVSVATKGNCRMHALVCHGLDVAAVAEAMCSLLAPALRGALRAGLGVDERSACAWVSLLAGRHDLGKASPSFQSQHLPVRQRLVQLGLPFARDIPRVPHGTITAAKLPGLLTSRLRSPASSTAADAAYNGPVRPEIERLLRQADRDFENARKNLTIQAYEVSAFLAHQAVEKYLKGLWMLLKKEPAPHTHSLTELGAWVGAPSDLRRHLADLTPDYTVSRYPNAANAVPYELYDEPTARSKVEKAEELIRWLRGRIPK